MLARLALLVVVVALVGCKGMPCRADCECVAALGEPESDNTYVACIGGHCTRSASEPGGGRWCRGYVNWPTNCICRGGTCDDRSCCILPDGAVAAPDDEVCRPMPCQADCECLAGPPDGGASGGGTCQGGRCAMTGIMTTAICGDMMPKEWPVYCACTVGTCDERGCCVQADGTVATATDPPCLPPDGDQ